MTRSLGELRLARYGAPAPAPEKPYAPEIAPDTDDDPAPQPHKLPTPKPIDPNRPSRIEPKRRTPRPNRRRILPWPKW